MNNYIKTISVLILALSFSFILKVHALPKPQKVKAKSQTLTIFDAKVQYILDFWNVGALDGSGQYEELIVILRCIESPSESGCGEDATATGTFSGGPNGTFKVEDVTFNLIDGRKTTAYDAGYSVTFTIENPEAFENFNSFTDVTKDQEADAEDKTKESTSEKTFEDVPQKAPNTITLKKAVGDITISDPDKQASITTKVGRTLLAITGRYDRRNQPWRKWEKPTQGMTLKPNTKLETKTGMAKIELKDGTVFIMRLGTKVLINRTGGIKLEKGSGYFIMPKTGERREVWARTGRIGVQGTEFSIIDDNEDTEGVGIYLVEGKVDLSPENSEEKLDLETGQYVVMTNSGFEEVKTFDYSLEKQQWENEQSSLPDEVTAEVEGGEETFIGTAILGSVFVVILVIVSLIAKRKK